MHVICHVFASSHRNLDCHRSRLYINNCISTPRLFSIHCLCLNFFHIRLHVTAVFFISNQDAISASGNNHILATHAENRDIQLVHHIGVLAGFVQDNFTLSLICHDFSHHIPGTNILPVTAVTQNLNARLFLDYRIVETDLGQGIIFIEQIAIILKVNHAVCFVQQIAQLKCKDTCIPQRTLSQILLSCFHIRFFLEFFNLADIFAVFRDDIAILFTWICRLNAHQRQICTILLCQFLQVFDSFIIGIVYIRVNWAYNNSLILCNAQFIMEISCSQCDGRERIAAARLYTNRSLFT